MKKVAAIVIFISLMAVAFIFVDGSKSLSRQQHPRTTMAVASPDVPQPEKDTTYSELVQIIHQEVNEFRCAHKLKPLTLNPFVSAQATEHSTDMARSGKISHSGFGERLKKIREKLSFHAAAENVAVDVGYKNPARAAVEGWKNSPEHRKNMLGNYSLTGIGVARNEQDRYFFTQIFLQL
jgi:uncharacterized protein YkwD